MPAVLGGGDSLQVELRHSDFGVARSVVQAVNARFGADVASAVDGRVIRIRAPAGNDARVAFLAALEDVDVELAVPAARVIINARTGSIVMNQSVALEACAVAHGNLTVTIASEPVVVQPAPFASGRTVVTERADVQLKQEGTGLVALPAGARLADVVKALNMLGASPADLLAILQAMKSAGALRAALEII